MSNLENLENRTLLSGANVSAVYAAGVLTVTGDTHNDSFSITENATGGGATVASTAKGTTINGFSFPYPTPGPVSKIVVGLTGTPSGTADNVKLLDLSSSTLSVSSVTVTVTGNAALTFAATGVKNAGTFSLTTSAWLHATVDSSSFNSLSIAQTGCCQAYVELGSDTISGHVTVSEGMGGTLPPPGPDIIIADSDSFGATSLSQGNGPGDSITVDPSKVLNLSITQGNGNGDSIVVDDVLVSNTSWGVSTLQGSGIGDSTTINLVDGYGKINNPTLVPSISVVQNDVYLLGGLVGDTATVSNSNVAGYISISQGGSNLDSASITNSTALLGWASITQGDGNSDSAAIVLVTAGSYVSITQGNGGISLPLFITGDSASITDVTAGGYVEITQGNGAGDMATIDPTSAGGDVSIYQGNGAGDSATISGTTAVNTTTGGSATIWQGNGAGDIAFISNVSTPTLTGNIDIWQGSGALDNASVDSCYAGWHIWIVVTDGAGDVASISNSTAFTLDITISMGLGDLDYAAISNDTAGGSATITQGNGTGDFALIDPTTVGGDLSITQGNGDGDYAAIAFSTAGGNLSIAQGNGNGDTAVIFGDTAGSVIYPYGPSYPVDVAGNATISQGNGYADEADLDGGNVVNNVYISQGDGIAYPGCLPGLGDEVDINDTQVTSDICIVQGVSSLDVGNNVVNIATTSAVFAGGATSINEVGVNNGNNTVTLGGANDPSGIDFQTDYLDIYTGYAGGGFVSAVNTVCWFGSAYGNDYVIDGGNGGGTLVTNTYDDLGNNYGITISVNYNYEFMV